MIASVSTMIIYLLVVVAFLGAARWTSFTASQSPLAAVFSSITHSEIGGIIITVGGVLAIIGSLNAVILGTARIATAMSNDGLFPKIFGRISVKRQTPYMSLLIQTVIAVILTYTVKDFVTLASIAVFFTIFPYAITAFATLGLIKKAGGRLDILHSKAIPLITGLVSIILLGTLSGPAVSPRSDSGPVLCRAADLHRAKEDPQAVKTWEMQPCGQVSLPACSSVFP